MKKLLMLLGVLLIVFCGFIVCDSYSQIIIPRLEIEEESVLINKIHIYGTHLNMSGTYNFTDKPELVLYNGDFLTYKINNLDGEFNLSEFVNDGIYLDEIPKGKYYLFLKNTVIEDGVEKFYYYPLKNNTEYKETTYYTMSNHSKKIVISNENSYPTMMMNVTKVKNSDVYDIVLDPGHGGMDGGASKNDYSETDFTMDISLKLKKKLEDIGFKVKLTHEKDQLSKNEKLPEYGEHGRALVAREVNAKYLFSIHMNSSESSYVNGLEVYTAKNINYDFANILVDNLVKNTGIGYSNNRINKISDGVYSRNFTQLEINNSMEGYNEDNLIPYDISINSNYYYMIRETGGIVTGAYVDDRNSDIMYNPYTNSNVGTETYLLELGYISNKNDLDNMINNEDRFVDSIASSIKTLDKLVDE